MNEYAPTQEQFKHDIRDHELFIQHNDGLYRHISGYCVKEGRKSCVLHFHITTWPGYLSITGDMGCCTFSGVEDMFCFFRADNERINLGYWMEKVQVLDGLPRDHCKRFSEQVFKDRIIEGFHDWIEDYQPNQDEITEVKNDIELYIFDELEELGEVAAYRAAMSFNRYELSYSDFWEADCTEYEYRFVWLCRAIVWAIQEYDKQQAQGVAL